MCVWIIYWLVLCLCVRIGGLLLQFGFFCVGLFDFCCFLSWSVPSLKSPVMCRAGCKTTHSLTRYVGVLLQVAFERNRGGQSVDMICRELMLDEEKSQTPKRPRTKKKKANSKACSAVSQPAADEDAAPASSATAATGNKTSNSCLVRHVFINVHAFISWHFCYSSVDCTTALGWLLTGILTCRLCLVWHFEGTWLQRFQFGTSVASFIEFGIKFFHFDSFTLI